MKLPLLNIDFFYLLCEEAFGSDGEIYDLNKILVWSYDGNLQAYRIKLELIVNEDKIYFINECLFDGLKKHLIYQGKSDVLKFDFEVELNDLDSISRNSYAFRLDIDYYNPSMVEDLKKYYQRCKEKYNSMPDEFWVNQHCLNDI